MEIKIDAAYNLNHVDTWKMLGVKSKAKALEKCSKLGIIVKEDMISTRKIWEALEDTKDDFSETYETDNAFTRKQR